ncbi:GNAT family N-acetyltransferase [Mesorhizobium sp. DCY119]|jgi:ribosomal protein S18 acetylase RimI-like enzyme|uniref:GNAT family N-acetyltransferase n=1 Tax=Mesorhizobium sp. DCY119 TaxID=2108445 RepID=UPI000E6C93F2|nr:GNAT family N-acetyltransferase [Mesorhizobium sp. DCY119]RJG44346.1 GNAT family N-acetyltransferase [Mesorhizobium sp. DCY119]
MADEQVVRFRRDLDADFPAPKWPAGFSMRTFRATDAQSLHTLLSEVFDDGEEGPFDTWWQKVSNDAEFDPSLCFLVFDGDDRLVAAALCWTSAYLKDLAVRPEARRRGLAEALLLQVFGTFQARDAAHVDLKTDLVKNPDAVRLYERMGMRRVPLEG